MSVSISEVWLEDRRGEQPIGIGQSEPRLSWTLPHGIDQAAAEVELTSEDGAVRRTVIQSSSSRLLTWPFLPLSSRQRVEVRIRVTGTNGLTTNWSAPLVVEAGLLASTDWAASFQSPTTSADHEGPRGAYLLRSSWRMEELGIDPGLVRRARIYATAHGVYELELNGSTVSDQLLAPGWTSYNHRIRYQTYDVTSLLTSGVNTIGGWVSDGWYRGRLGFNGGLWDNYGSDLSLLAQLDLVLVSGETMTVPLDGRWEWSRSPITASSLYDGEHFDARHFNPRWTVEPRADQAEWAATVATPIDAFPGVLEAPINPPVRVTDRLRPVAAYEVAPGVLRVDFGQNIAGKLSIRVRGERGHRITLRHAEVLEDGGLGIRPLRTAESLDSYTCAGSGLEEWSPRFTIHGFRYAEIENWPGDPAALDVEALVMHSDMERVGWFESSHPGLNQLHRNVVWSMRDNFVDLPTDCPQRDERLGWTGDIQVFAPTALFLYGAQGVLSSWLRDVAVEQADQGHVPNFVPWIECGFPNFATAAWGDAAVIVPWEIYLHDGDPQILATQYDSMRAWVELVHALSSPDGLWDTGFQLGDWLDPAAPPDAPGDSATDRYLVASAYHIRTAQIMAQTAELLGRVEDAERYRAMSEQSVEAFRALYVDQSGRVRNDTVTAISLCLVFDLLESAQQTSVAGRRLVELVAAADYRIATGFVGTPIVCDALVKAGALEAAYRLLLQTDVPSWLYAVTMGATTVWERWDSMLPNGAINPGEMTSFNHYALGAVADFMHRVVAGLDRGEAGWKSVRIQPRPGGGLTRASARHLSPLGLVESSWTRFDDRFVLTIELPAGATGTVVLPGQDDAIPVGPGRRRFEVPYTPALLDDLSGMASGNGTAPPQPDRSAHLKP